MKQVDICDICDTPVILAEQLTHIEMERLHFIGPEEFVQAFAEETKEKIEVCTFPQHKQFNLTNL